MKLIANFLPSGDVVPGGLVMIATGDSFPGDAMTVI